SDSAGQNFPVDYFKVKENLMPLEPTPTSSGRDVLPAGVSPSSVIKHIEASATDSLRRNLVSGGAPEGIARDLAEVAYRQADQSVRRHPAPHERAYAARAAS